MKYEYYCGNWYRTYLSSSWTMFCWIYLVWQKVWATNISSVFEGWGLLKNPVRIFSNLTQPLQMKWRYHQWHLVTISIHMEWSETQYLFWKSFFGLENFYSKSSSKRFFGHSSSNKILFKTFIVQIYFTFLSKYDQWTTILDVYKSI